MVPEPNGDLAELEIVNDYKWIGMPDLGKVRVFVDGEKVAEVPVGGTYRVAISPGEHTLRCSVYRYATPPQVIRLEARGVERRYVSQPTGKSAYFRMLFRPRMALYLGPLNRDARRSSKGNGSTRSAQ